MAFAPATHWDQFRAEPGDEVADAGRRTGAGDGEPWRSRCRRREVRRGSGAPLVEPSLAQQLGIAVTGHLELPRGFSRKVGEIMQEEAAGLIKSGTWLALLTLPHGTPGSETPHV